MYPLLFRIGDFEVTSFGAMVAVAALVGVWIFRRELRRSGLPEDTADAGVWGVLGGLAGAKLLWAFEHIHEEPLRDLLLSRGGLSWYGGLIGGVLVGLAVLRSKGRPVTASVAAATPALAVGHLLGRVGCFLVGDDYGRPTNLPWGVAFPQGLPPTSVPVHPTQLYEAAFLGVLAWWLIRWRRQGVVDHLVLGRYLVLAGAARFVIEFIRVNPRVAFGLTVAQWVSLLVVGLGSALLVWRRRQLVSEQSAFGTRRRTAG
jgi:phosphatidylglycerol:prolipoprotein diacylglycerol transferase